MRPRLFLLIGCLAAGLAAATLPAAPVAAGGWRGERLDAGGQIGGIRGRLIVQRPARPAERRPEVADPGAGGPRDLPDHQRGVVYLETAPRAAFDERSPVRVIMDQRNERFVPNLLAVMVGTVVDFPNSDSTYHNVFSLSRAKRFDLGRYAAGRSKSVLMERPGIVRVFCDIHSHMSAYVLVFAHPFFDVTGVDGRYEIGNLPPATYSVVGWYEGQARVTRTIAVVAGTWTDLDMVVP
jgi:plastocyanin